jgi:hypothetical protein
MKTKHLILLLLFVAVSCSSKNNKESNADKEQARIENMDGTSASEGDNPFVYTGITEDVLWEIFLKIPVDSMSEYLFTTKEQRLQARADKAFNKEYNDADSNVLEYDETNMDGVRNFMRLACYPTDDGKKLIAIFHYGGGVDIFGTSSDQTYEYDIATGDLKAIERPMDPYTVDEFFYETILSPEQHNQLLKSFSKEMSLNYVLINKSGYSKYFAAYNAFEEWEEYEEYDDLVRMFYMYGDNFVRREWNGKRFVKTETYPPDYLIDDKSVGRFKIGELIAFPYPPDEDVYSFEKSERTEMREGTEEKIIEYTFVRYNDTMLIIRPLYDSETDAYTDRIGEITVLSEKYKTKDKIGVNTGLDDFIAIYPKHSFWWTYVSDKYVLESEHVNGNVQFILDAGDCIITPKTDSDMTILKRNDFTKDAQIKKIRVF